MDIDSCNLHSLDKFENSTCCEEEGKSECRERGFRKDLETGTQSALRLRLPSEGYFGSDLTLNEYGGGSEVGGVSECQSEVDLRYNVASGGRFSGGGGGSRSYVGGAYDTDHEDERSVVSDSNHHLPASSR